MNDGISAIVHPLQRGISATEDFQLHFSADHEHSDPMREAFTLHLDDICVVDRVVLLPVFEAEKETGGRYALPLPMAVELSQTADFSCNKRYEITENDSLDGSMLSFRFPPEKARHVRFYVHDPGSQQALSLQLGEAMVLNGDRVCSEKASVTASAHAEAVRYPERLVDGLCSGRRILPAEEWVPALAERAIAEKRLKQLSAARERLRQKSYRILIPLLFFLLGGLLAMAVVWVLYTRWKNRQIVPVTRQLVAHDLHEEVGATLGRIAARSEALLDVERDPDLENELEEICYDANDAASSLSEAMWSADYGLITLEDVLDRFREHAWRMMPHVEIELVIMGLLPGEALHPAMKRRLSQFFKPVIHNCTRHARASHVRIECSLHGGMLRLVVLDDGIGFDPVTIKKGRGLPQMEEQAQELDGALRVESVIDHGTTIVLEVPLKTCVIAD